jgi:hypothetical protein
VIIRGSIGGARAAIVSLQRVFRDTHDFVMAPMIRVDLSPYFVLNDPGLAARDL